MVYGQVPEFTTSLYSTFNKVSQLSVALTPAGAGMSSHSTVRSEGTPTNTGSTVSVTVMVWV